MDPFQEQKPDTDQHHQVLPQFRLPSTMSGLLEAAIKDARAIDRSRYMPFSEEWHNALNSSVCEVSPADDGNCHVCLAGSLIAETFLIPFDLDFAPFMFSDVTMRKLEAVDSMRCGFWRRVFDLIYAEVPSKSISDKLEALGMPDNADFYGWGEFDRLLNSLESLVPRLREIDEAMTT